MKTQNFSGWHLLLTIAALLALTAHNALHPLWNQVQIGMIQWTQLNQLQAITQWSLPVFVSLVGVIFLSSSQTWNTHTLWRRIIPITALSCVFWWCASAVLYLQQYFPNEMDLPTFSHCLSMVLSAPSNIGYCQMLVSMFMLYPLLRRIAQDQHVLGYCLITLFILNLLLPLLRHILVISIVSLFFDQLNWGFFHTWAFYLFLGAYLTKSMPSWPLRLTIYCLGIISTALTIALTSWMTKGGPGYFADFTGLHSPLTACQTAAVFLFASQFFRRFRLTHAVRTFAGLWMSVPVAFVVYSFTSRFLPIYNGFVPAYVFPHMFIDTLLTLLLTAAMNALPGFRCLVGYYQAEGEQR